MDLTALCPLPCHASDSAPEGSRAFCGCASLLLSILLAGGPSDSVAAVAEEDKMPLWRCKSEECPQANAGLTLRGVLQVPLPGDVSRPEKVAIMKDQEPAERTSAGVTGPVTPQCPQRTSARFSLTQLSHLRCTLTLKQQQQSEKAACPSVSYLVCSSFMWFTI